MSKPNKKRVDVDKTKISFQFTNGERVEKTLTTIIFYKGGKGGKWGEKIVYGMPEELFKSVSGNKVGDIVSVLIKTKKPLLKQVVDEIITANDGGSFVIVEQSEFCSSPTIDIIPASALRKISLL